ncbi:ThiS family protein [Corynebacterium occultum]|uniref:ThiS family protein n=1 Tax=Corynebacterium occultum TaxID=2675219 RepID=A0A6B8W5M0_9CORY|nr:MoaD/ThiS family protein [Corynebacterium occultum]QGU06216.1 ThiS family protein [Corynebacterium occultum]
MEVHYFAAARAARGTAQETLEQVPATLAELLSQLAADNGGTTEAGMNLAEIFERCTFLVDGAKAESTMALAGAHRVDVLPPFAGG